MIRTCVALVMSLWAAALGAQEAGFSALARVDMGTSRLEDLGDGLRLRLALSQGVPFRVFTLAEPARLVLDFREVDWRGVEPGRLDRAEGASAVRVGSFRPGWSRMVVDLAGPYAVGSVDARRDERSGGFALEVILEEVGEGEFAARSGAPELPGWEPATEGLPAVRRTRRDTQERLLVVIDPGHGGVDPGAMREGESEKDLMLRFARELGEVLLRAGGFDVALTRGGDEFVSLERRVAIAHELGADVFISLHADALSSGRARGATVYTLADSASDEASAALAERHNRANILAGVDLSESDDVVADVLIDLARMETQPRADQLAQAIRGAIRQAGLPLNSRPLRSAGFSVLKSPDIPSVLLELGFVSSPRDLKNLRDPQWRVRMARAVRDALRAWRRADAAAAELTRR